MTKAIECHYPINSPRGTGARTPHKADVPIRRQRASPSLVVDSPSIGNRQDTRSDENTDLNSTLLVSDPDFANLGPESFDWEDLDLDFADFLSPQTSDETVEHHSFESPSLASHSTTSTNQMVLVHQAMSSPTRISIPQIPTSAPRSLIQRTNLKIGVQRVADLLLHTLKSYPLMMLRHNKLPPYVHPHLVSSSIENDQMEPLANCIALVHMISSGVRGSRKLFWKNVRVECEHLCEEVP